MITLPKFKIPKKNNVYSRTVVRTLLLLTCFIFSVSVAQAIGNLRWEQPQTLNGEAAGIQAVTTLGRQIYVAGTTTGDGSSTYPRTAYIRAYSISDGQLLWENTFGEEDNFISIRDIQADKYHIFVSGYVTDNYFDQDWIMKAYTITGEPLWENRFDFLGWEDHNPWLALDDSTVYAAGFGGDEEGYYDTVIRAYDSESGVLLWEDVIGIPENFDGANGIVADNGFVYVYGSGTFGITPDTRNWIVQAYDGMTGQIIWQDEVESGTATAALLLNNQLFVTGATNGDWTVKAYDSSNGTLLWQDKYDLDNQSDSGSNLVGDNQYIYVVGRVATESSQWDWFVRTYSISDGNIIWQEQFDKEGLNEIATNAAVQGQKLFVGGNVNTNAGGLDWQIREYDIFTGDLSGTIELVDSSSFDNISNIHISGLKLVFAARENNVNYLRVYNTQ